MRKLFMSGLFALLTVTVSSHDASAGAVGGARSGTAVVFPQKYYAHAVVFRGHEPGKFRVRGDGSTDLDCYVYDSDGNVVDSDTDSTDYCVLNWYAPYTQVYTLQVVNHGHVSNLYNVWSN